MVMRCILGCSPPKPLFPIPKTPWLRARWLEFLHFDEGGITENTRLCARHFTQESFKNFRQHEMGFVKLLLLTGSAVPSVYTVGAPASAKPLTRDVGCQCSPKPTRSTAVQAARSTPRPKRRSKAVQVKPPTLSIGMSSSAKRLGSVLNVTSSQTNKRQRVKEQAEDCEIGETWSSSSEESTASDLPCESDVSQEDSDTSLFAAHYYDGSADWEYVR